MKIAPLRDLLLTVITIYLYQQIGGASTLLDNLQVTLIIALVAMALINLATLFWAWHLSNRLNKRPVPKVYEVRIEGTKVFSEIDLAEVEKQARVELQQSAHNAANQLHEAIKRTVEQVAMHVDETTQNTINQELEKYHVSLQALREQSITEFSKMQQDLDQKRIRMTEALERVAKAELGRRMDQFNSRLSDVVSSYIVESLGSQVDLGAQLPYILQNLEKHKEDIKKDVLN